MDPDALWVIRRLRGARFHAYMVGGAVRDLLVGRMPKDFDVATDAHPQQIKRLFRSATRHRAAFPDGARLLRPGEVHRGHHFPLPRSTAATGDQPLHPDANNFFGTMEEDAERRDFTINALYYCPIDEQLIDYVGLSRPPQRRLKTLGRAETSFAEDPVRMIRAVKYASLLGFPVPPALGGLVRRMRESVLSLLPRKGDGGSVQDPRLGRGDGHPRACPQAAPFRGHLSPHSPRTCAAAGSGSPSSPAARLRSWMRRRRAGHALDRSEMFGFLFRDLRAGPKGAARGSASRTC